MMSLGIIYSFHTIYQKKAAIKNVSIFETGHKYNNNWGNYTKLNYGR